MKVTQQRISNILEMKKRWLGHILRRLSLIKEVLKGEWKEREKEESHVLLC